MKLKLKESIQTNAASYAPPAVIDIADIGISEHEATDLVARGVAELFDGEAPAEVEAEAEAEAPTDGAPEVIHVAQADEAPAPAARTTTLTRK